MAPKLDRVLDEHDMVHVSDNIHVSNKVASILNSVCN